MEAAETWRPAACPAARPLGGLAVLGGAGTARERLARWGAACEPGTDAAALRHALAKPGVTALCWLPPDQLPIRPPAEIAAALLDGAEHVGPRAQSGWCLTAGAARRALRLLPEGAATPEDLHGAALIAAGGRLAPPPCHAGPAPLRLADLPAAFASGRPFAGPFAPDDAMTMARALGASEAARRPSPVRLPPELSVVGAAPVPRAGEVLGIIVARDEALRLPDALVALRRLGVDRAVVVDNGSSDATRAVAEQAGAHVIAAEGDYAAAGFGIAWTNAVLDAYARGHWALVLDADEQLVFPGSDRIGLRALTAHLDALGSEALRTVLLDMFPPGPLACCDYRAGAPLLATAALFEPPRLRREPITDFPYSLDYGGIRERLFFPEAHPGHPSRWLWQRLYNLGLRVPALREAPLYARLAPPRSPALTKVPLLRWREGAALIASTHRVAPMRMAEAQPSGVLLHFKFLQDFHARAVDAVTRGAHWGGSREYRRYLARLLADPRFALGGPRALAYEGPAQLVALGLMRDTPDWRRARGTG